MASHAGDASPAQSTRSPIRWSRSSGWHGSPSPRRRVGAIGSVALLLRHGLGLPDAADAVDRGIEQAIETGARTRDIAEPGGPELGTRAMGERIAEAVRIAECGVRSGDSLGDSALRIPHSALE